MNYGYFDDEKKEYVITTPHTPTKWINYIGGLDFGGFVDHLGGGVICKGDPALNRIVKYMPQLPDSSFNGEGLYIRIHRSSDYELISPFYVPTLNAYKSYQCRVGLGYSIFEMKTEDLEIKVTVFVPRDHQVVLRDIVVKNISEYPIALDVIPVVEYTHFDALKQFTNADWVPQTMMSDLRKDGPFTILNQYAFMHKDISVNYFTSNERVDSFETDRRKFLKDHEGGTWQRPLSLMEKTLSNYEARRGDNIGALLHAYKDVKPNEQIRLITQLGQYNHYEKELNQIRYYRDAEHVEKALQQLKLFWEDHLSVYHVKSPDENFNRMVNIFNPRQCYVTKHWSRYLSLYQLGLGARGIGIRDASQDVMGIISQKPEEAKVLLRTILSMQRINGSSYHQYNPKSLEASVGDAHEDEALPDYYGDDHLWPILAVCEYLKETGDYKFLEEKLPFYEKDKTGIPVKVACVLSHLMDALNFTKHDLGKNQLPLLGFADWNDTVNLKKGAESFFIANLYGVVLNEMVNLLEFLHDENAQVLKADYEQMKEKFNDVGWDGKWFRRYITAEGEFLGSSNNEEGKIFTNGQSWSVLSGFASEDKGKMALNAVYEKLNTSNGIKLSTPGYNGYDKEKGGVTSYPPGAKENGGIFLHANPWVMIAETMYGNGNRAFEYYNQINPINKNNKIEAYELAPYVYPQNILGDEHPQFGLGRNCWLSGTSSWAYQAATKYILGLQPEHYGLVIDPCIPEKWEALYVERRIRDASFKIHIKNPLGKSKGVSCILLNGKVHEGKAIPYLNGTHDVEIILG
ncbi:MAG: glycosyl transferase [Clostridia bacterium]|nr:glycosyl transferase [Clostridia bacterium]